MSADGYMLMREGDLAQEFFLIIDGRVRIERDGSTLATLGARRFPGRDRAPGRGSANRDGRQRGALEAPRPHPGGVQDAPRHVARDPRRGHDRGRRAHPPPRARRRFLTVAGRHRLPRRSRPPARRDPRRVIAQLGEDLVGVLAEGRRRRADRGRRRRSARTGCPTWRMTPQRRVRPARRSSRAPPPRAIANAREDVVDRPARDLGRVQRRAARRPSARRRTARPGSGASSARLSTRSPLVANRGSAASPGKSQRRAEPRPLALRPDRDRDRAVGGRERLVRDDVRVGVAEPARGDARHERVLGLVDQARQRGAEERDVDRWPAPPAGPASRSRPTSAPGRRRRRASRSRRR